MNAWFDAHNHLHDPRLGDSSAVIAAAMSAGVGHCVVNATCEADWPAVETLALEHPGFVTPAFGIHPWKAGGLTDGWLERLVAMLEKHPRALIGECGLDRWVSTPPVETQLPVFHAQVDLARETGRALAIHCLRAWGLLLDSFEAHPPPPRFLMHSFGGSVETARRLLPLGAYFSFSGHFLHERKAAALQVFRDLPRERILVETDAPDMLPPPEHVTHSLPEGANHPANLPAIGGALAHALGMDAAELAPLSRSNALAWMGR